MSHMGDLREDRHDAVESAGHDDPDSVTLDRSKVVGLDVGIVDQLAVGDRPGDRAGGEGFVRIYAL